MSDGRNDLDVMVMVRDTVWMIERPTTLAAWWFCTLRRNVV